MIVHLISLQKRSAIFAQRSPLHRPKFLLFSVILLTTLLITACSGETTPEEPIDPLALVTESAENIRNASAFRLTVDQVGPDYEIFTDYGTVIFRRAQAQYAPPGEMQAAIRVIAAGLPLDIDVFSRGDDQWYRAIWTANQWINQYFQPGFNPASLIAEDTGFQSALNAIIDLEFLGEVQLESGVNTYHLRGTADGEDVRALLVDLIMTYGNVVVDVYVDIENRVPARIVLNEQVAITNSDGSAGVEDREWLIDIYDVNQPVTFDDPEAGNAEATLEVTDEAE